MYLGRVHAQQRGLADFDCAARGSGLRVTAMLDWQLGHYKFNNNTRARCSVFFVCRENVLPAQEYDARDRRLPSAVLDIQGEFVEKANFAKLREVSIGYDVPEFVRVACIGARAASINLAMRNLHTLTNYTGLDPENMFLSGTTRQRRAGQPAAAGPDHYHVPRCVLGGGGMNHD